MLAKPYCHDILICAARTRHVSILCIWMVLGGAEVASVPCFNIIWCPQIHRVRDLTSLLHYNKSVSNVNLRSWRFKLVREIASWIKPFQGSDFDCYLQDKMLTGPALDARTYSSEFRFLCYGQLRRRHLPVNFEYGEVICITLGPVDPVREMSGRSCRVLPTSHYVMDIIYQKPMTSSTSTKNRFACDGLEKQ